MNIFKTADYIPHLSIDCVIFGYDEGQLKVLISKLKYGENLWGLPGGYIRLDEGLDQAAKRILKEHTNLRKIYLEQFRVFGGKDRISKSKYKSIIQKGLKSINSKVFNQSTIDWITNRFICIGYYALVDIKKTNPQPGFFEELLDWKNVNDLPSLTHDHNQIIQEGISALQRDIDSKLIGFNLLGDEFTMKELQLLYEAIYNKNFPMNNFQKKILSLNVLERLEKKYTGGQHKAPFLYRFKNS